MEQLIRPRKSSHPSNIQSNGYVPPVEALDSAFCNSFWIQADKRALPGSDPSELGAEGYNTIMQRMKNGSKTLEELRTFLRERATFEDEFAKKLSKQAKVPLGPSEIGHLVLALQRITSENEVVARVHSDLANVLRDQEAKVVEFLARRDGGRKLQQNAIERDWKNKVTYEAALNKARSKYESDCKTINGLNAQAALVQGKEGDKVNGRLDKVLASAATHQKEFATCVKLLQDTNPKWTQSWKSYCDVCQDQEEERCDFLKNRCWDFANAVSTEAVSTDSSAERIRVALEQCSPVRDLKIFVQLKGTGNDIPDPPVFVDFSQKVPAPGQTWRKARFVRSSTRGPGRSTGSSSVQDITRAFQSSTSISEPQNTSVNSSPAKERHNEPRQQADQQPVSALAYSAPVARPVSVDRNDHTELQPSSPTKKSTLSGLAALENAISPSRSSTTLARQASAEPATPSPSSSPRKESTMSAAHNRSLTPTTGSARASDFPRRVVSPLASPAKEERIDFPPSPPVKRETALASKRSGDVFSGDGSIEKNTIRGTALDEEDDDPLMKAYNALRSTPSSGALRSAGASRQQRSRPGSMEVSSPSKAHQQTLGRAAGDREQPQQQQRSSYSRPTSPAPSNSDYRPRSPAPTAQLMSAPRIPPAAGSSVVETYGQSFPGEREERAASRQQNRNSNPVNYSTANAAGGDRYGRAPSPQPFAGVGARGRSPSPQPFARPPSPGMVHSSNNGGGGAQRSNYLPRSTSPQPPLGYSSAPPQQYQQHTNVPPDQRGQQSQYIRSPSPAPANQSYAAPPPTQRQASHSSLSSYASSAPPSQSHYQPSSQQQSYQQQQPGYRQASPYQQAPFQQQQHHIQQQQHEVSRTSSVNSSVVPNNYQPPPSQSQPQYYQQQHQQGAPVNVAARRQSASQFTEGGVPIICFVRALYDYDAPTGGDYFSFRQGDRIPVTVIRKDGWWISPLGTFPSNFTERLP